jgi:hypothetical protein
MIWNYGPLIIRFILPLPLLQRVLDDMEVRTVDHPFHTPPSSSAAWKSVDHTPPSSSAAWKSVDHTPPSSPAAWEEKAERHTCHPMFHTPPSSPAARERKGAGGKVRATRRTWQHRPGNRRHPVPAHREATFHRARSSLPPPSPSSPAA